MPRNAPSSSQCPEPRFTLLNNLKTYNDHQAQILCTFAMKLCTLRYEAEQTWSDRKCREELVQWLSRSLPPAAHFRENLLRHLRMFLTLYQFLMMRNVFLDKNNK